ncbi:MAG: hypothetical protein FWD71_11385 [Oscillospiraceae bacterium]|nr:hypothetical protein [Oscillospiraceae bacterium]
MSTNDDLFTVKRDELKNMIIEFNEILKRPAQDDIMEDIRLNYLSDNFEKYYGIDLTKYKNKKGEVILPYEVSALYSLMVSLMSNDYNFLKNGKKRRKYKTSANIKDFMEYNKQVIKGIDKLPKPIYTDISICPEYEYGRFLSRYMPAILERLGVLLISIIDYNFRSRKSLTKVIDDLDKTIDNFISNYYSLIEDYSLFDGYSPLDDISFPYVSIDIKEDRINYFDKVLGEIFEKYSNRNFSKESKTPELLIKKFKKEKYKNYKKEKYRNVYLKGFFQRDISLFRSLNNEMIDSMLKETEISEYDSEEDETVKNLEISGIKHMFYNLYKSFPPYCENSIPEGFNKLKNKDSIIKDIRKQFELCMSIIKHKLFLLMLFNAISLPYNKSESFIFFIKSSFDDLVELDNSITNEYLENESPSISMYEWASLKKEKFDWEDIFNDKAFYWRDIGELGEQKKTFSEVSLWDNENFIKFYKFTKINKYQIVFDFFNIDFNKYFSDGLEERATTIAKKILEFDNWADFSKIVREMIASNAKELFGGYIEMSKDISEKYYKYKEQYKKIESSLDSIIGQIFRNFAVDEMATNKIIEKKPHSRKKIIICPNCNEKTEKVVKNGKLGNIQKYKCCKCNRTFQEKYIYEGCKLGITKKVVDKIKDNNEKKSVREMAKELKISADKFIDIKKGIT